MQALLPTPYAGSPYCGKASDMWSMGVLLFTMLFGQFPFYDNEPQELFKKIRAASYTIPNESHVTMETTLLIKQLIRLDVKTRLTAVGALEAIQNRLSRFRPLRTIETVPEASQIVPDVEGMGEEDCMVPDHSTDASSASARPIDGSVAANIHLTALRLSLSPQALNPDVYLPPGTFANLSNSPVASPNSLLLFPDTLAYPSGNPFLCTNGAHAQPFMSSTGLSTSPPSVPGFGSLHIHSASPSSSFPPPSYLHRIPVTLSLGTDYYQHSSSAPSSLHQPASMMLFSSSSSTGNSLVPRTLPPGTPAWAAGTAVWTRLSSPSPPTSSSCPSNSSSSSCTGEGTRAAVWSNRHSDGTPRLPGPGARTGSRPAESSNAGGRMT
eukprot:Em0023g721a